MKHVLSQTSFILAVFLLLSGCQKDKSLSRMIGPEDEDVTPTLIIEKVGPSGIEVLNKNENQDNKYLSSLMIYRHMENGFSMPPFQWTGIELKAVNPTSDPWGYYFTFDLGKPTIAGIDFRSRIGFLNREVEHIGNLSITIKDTFNYDIGWSIWPDTLNINRQDDVFYQSDQVVLFKIKDSPVVQDIEVELEIPNFNMVTNIQGGQTLNANEDLIIKTKYPIEEGFLIEALEVTVLEEGWHSCRSSESIYVQPTLPTSELIIPSEEILQFMDENPEANGFEIWFWLWLVNKEIQLYDHEGNPYQILPVNFLDIYQVFFYFTRETTSSVKNY